MDGIYPKMLNKSKLSYILNSLKQPPFFIITNFNQDANF